MKLVSRSLSKKQTSRMRNSLSQAWWPGENWKQKYKNHPGNWSWKLACIKKGGWFSLSKGHKWLRARSYWAYCWHSYLTSGAGCCKSAIRHFTASAEPQHRGSLVGGASSEYHHWLAVRLLGARGRQGKVTGQREEYWVDWNQEWDRDGDRDWGCNLILYSLSWE